MTKGYFNVALWARVDLQLFKRKKGCAAQTPNTYMMKMEQKLHVVIILERFCYIILPVLKISIMDRVLRIFLMRF